MRGREARGKRREEERREEERREEERREGINQERRRKRVNQKGNKRRERGEVTAHNSHIDERLSSPNHHLAFPQFGDELQQVGRAGGVTLATYLILGNLAFLLFPHSTTYSPLTSALPSDNPTLSPYDPAHPHLLPPCICPISLLPTHPHLFPPYTSPSLPSLHIPISLIPTHPYLSLHIPISSLSTHPHLSPPNTSPSLPSLHILPISSLPTHPPHLFPPFTFPSLLSFPGSRHSGGKIRMEAAWGQQEEASISVHYPVFRGVSSFPIVTVASGEKEG
ncbi:hypothetical protein Pcinc_036692 [Petrolisthes cinctipes]|uniref:Uncharacterized protein n=1 Tax=Petrolisthes cinctipes TaxID=88211 RepID=A0AAE1BUB3_PETCI|nr:hypothetical protein Pcinc_036692 [Petrolisthes cinctipes]